MRSFLVAGILTLLLAGWGPCSRFVRADPVPAQCEAICYVNDAKSNDETACASRARWEGDPADSGAIDSLIYGTLPASRKETWDCGIRLKACQQCLQRLAKAKVIVLP